MIQVGSLASASNVVYSGTNSSSSTPVACWLPRLATAVCLWPRADDWRGTKEAAEAGRSEQLTNRGLQCVPSVEDQLEAILRRTVLPLDLHLSCHGQFLLRRHRRESPAPVPLRRGYGDPKVVGEIDGSGGKVRINFKDDANACNGAMKDSFAGKGVLCNEITCLLFEHLEEKGIQTHYLWRESDSSPTTWRSCPWRWW